MAELEGDREILGQVLELLAHDLRNPLSALHSNLGYLKNVTPQGSVDADVLEAITDGLASCEGLSHIIANLSAFAQMLRGAPQVHGTSQVHGASQVPGTSQSQAVPAPAVAFMSDALKRTANTARTYGTTIELEVTDAAKNARLSLSSDLLSRALVNLILNAIHCSPRRSLVQLTLTAFPEQAQLQLSVHDLGPPLEESADAFGVVAQLASKTLPRGRYSRWLGLHVASIAAQSMGGTLESLPAKGGFTSCLTLTLPTHRS